VDPLTPLARRLNERHLWAHAGGVVFKTDDRDLFLCT
jgi:hypothetical protein